MMRLAIVILLLAPAPALAQVKDGKDDKVYERRSGPTSADAAGIDRGQGGDRRFRSLPAAQCLGTGLEGPLHDPRGADPPIRRRREGFHHPDRAETADDPRRPAAGRPGRVPAVLRRRGEEAARCGRRAVGAEEPRARSSPPISSRPSATMRPTGWAISTSSWGASTGRPIAGWRSCANAPTRTSRPP